MKRKGFDGMYVLRLAEGGAPVDVNSMIIDFRGNCAILKDGTAPHKASSQGFVIDQHDNRYYASVFGLKWVKEQS